MYGRVAEDGKCTVGRAWRRRQERVKNQEPNPTLTKGESKNLPLHLPKSQGR